MSATDTTNTIRTSVDNLVVTVSSPGSQQLAAQVKMLGVFAPAIVAAYFVGAIPFGQIIAKMHGKDLRSIGSGNIGATNVSRAGARGATPVSPSTS